VAWSRQGHQDDKEGCALGGAKVSRLPLLYLAVVGYFSAKNADDVCAIVLGPRGTLAGHEEHVYGRADADAKHER
jgi:hypothetical protein